MIIGIGNDIVDIRRIEKLLEKSSQEAKAPKLYRLISHLSP